MRGGVLVDGEKREYGGGAGGKVCITMINKLTFSYFNVKKSIYFY